METVRRRMANAKAAHPGGRSEGPGKSRAARSTSTSSATGRPTATAACATRSAARAPGLAEMTNAGLPVPPGFTISTDVCSLYYKQKGKIPSAIDAEIAEQHQEARKGRRRDARVDREPAARVGAIGRQVLDARDDGHDPQPRAQRRGGRRAEGANRRTAGSPSTATAASCRCSAASSSRFRRTCSSTSSRR